MATALKDLAAAAAFALALSPGSARAQEPAGRHQWAFELQAGYLGASSALGAWTRGGPGKLRYDETDEGIAAGRVMAEYRGRLTPTLRGRAVIDYVDDASSGLGVTEAYLEWRPVPASRNRHRWRLGAFYPPFSFENGGPGWSSPFTVSFSAVNTWLAEEIRVQGAEWSVHRRTGSPGSPHELGVFAAAFHGNDPAGTLLFWRGWALHDRQTRLNDTLRIPQSPVYEQGAVVGLRDQHVQPFDDIDHDPGYYAGVEWRYARRARMQAAHYDNRADPYAFSDGQWGWTTAFNQIAFQLELPGRLGLIGQWMRGETRWLVGVGLDGVVPPFAYLAEDEFESAYLLLTRSLVGGQRVSVRYEEFDILRAEVPPRLHADGGNAWTLAYRYEHAPRLAVAAEWMRVESERDLWPLFYGLPGAATEHQVRVQVTLRLGVPSRASR